MSDATFRSPLHDRHVAAGAKLAPFGGWSMPLTFAGTASEHAAVREDVGVFDVSHLGTVWVTGPAAAATVGRALTVDAAALAVGASRYGLCLAADGGILDDLIVYRLDDARLLVVPNAANTATVVGRLRDTAREVAHEARDEVAAAAAGDDPDPAALAVGTALVDDASTGWAIVAIQGPSSAATVAAALHLDVTDLAFTAVTERAIGDVGTAAGAVAVVCRTGYTGEPGVELLVPAEHAVAVWDALVAAGATPCGLGARDTLRLEMGYPLHGQDLGPQVRPADARLRWAVQGEDADGTPRTFVGAGAVGGPARTRLLGLRSAGRRPLRAGCPVTRDGVEVGTTTSGGFSPTLGVGIALAALDPSLEPGTQVQVVARGGGVDVEVVRPPFVDRDPRG